ncbi:MAG: glycosyltransferase family 4 protein [Pseudomonadota bacterium]
MNILYFIEEAKLGGPQVQMARVAAMLAERANIEIVMPEENSEAFRQLCDESGVRYRTFPISRLTKEAGPLVTFFLRSPLEVVRLVRHVRQTRPDFIHAWGGSWQIKAAIVSRLAGVPLIWLINDTKVPGVILTMFRGFARLCDGFIFASHRSADCYLRHIPPAAPTAVIQSMVNLDAFDPVREYPGDEDFIASLGDATVVGMIANINPVKGIETFIRVAAHAQVSGLDTRFVVIGQVFPRQQAYFDRLKALCLDLGATNLIFAGGRRDVRAVLKRFDIYLCTSVAESSPVAVWEAMAMGRAVVSTDVGDVPRFVQNGESGYIASVGDDLALWRAVETLCANRDLARRMGAAARTAAAVFGRAAIADQTMAFYRAVIGQGADISVPTKTSQGADLLAGGETSK